MYAVLKSPRLYQHVAPESVGNKRQFLVSDLAGTAHIEALVDSFTYAHLLTQHNAKLEAFRSLKPTASHGRPPGARTDLLLQNKDR